MSDNLQINGLAWRGVPVEQLTKEQLVQTIYALASEMTALQVTAQKMAELRRGALVRSWEGDDSQAPLAPLAPNFGPLGPSWQNK
jgi:hypothetical protein